MMNMSIECTVKGCIHHHDVENYCMKEQIEVLSTHAGDQESSCCGSYKGH